MRDLGEVDIVELTYDVLPWGVVDDAQLFESDAVSILGGCCGNQRV